MHQGPGGKWWDNPEIVKRLGLTADQQKKIDEIFQQHRLKLIDLHATLEKEEVVLEGLMRGSQLDDTKILPSSDKIAQARAELEKANNRLMLAIGHVLTPDQRQKMQDDQQHAGGPNGGGPPQPFRGNGPHPRGGPNGGGPPPMHPQEEE